MPTPRTTKLSQYEANRGKERLDSAIAAARQHLKELIAIRHLFNRATYRVRNDGDTNV